MILDRVVNLRRERQHGRIGYSTTQNNIIVSQQEINLNIN
jgi:hypothetical protein